MRKIIYLGAVVLVLLLIAAHLLVPPYIERNYNPVVTSPGDKQASALATDLHAKLRVVDLHADPLLWNRDLAKRSGIGHVDVPRLVEGNVAIQVFGLVTQSPKGQNVDRNTADTDRITALVIAQAWPPRTWGSYLERALYQIDKFNSVVTRSDGHLLPLRNQTDLETLLRRHADGEAVVGGLLGLEGSHALEGEFTSVDRLFDAGLRMLGLTHFIDNAVAGSAHGVSQAGLSDFGREAVENAQRLGMIIDVAHASPQAIDDVLQITTAPIVVSHGGVRATCDTPRNLSDAQISGIAGTDGVIGVGLFEIATCGNDLKATVAAMRHIADLVGVEHVGLGSDFNGAVATPIDSADLSKLTQALLDNGFSDEDITKIMGGNAIRVFQQVLPPA